MMRSFRRTSILLALCAALAAPPAVSAQGLPDRYRLDGDPGDAAGSKFEGIGLERRTGTFYVSETTGGEIHRGDLTAPETDVWLEGDGTDGRHTARGIAVDRHGRVYVAGGPNGLDHAGAPDLWVYDRSGTLLAALRVPADGAFLNDVTIGPDGAAYVTDSNTPRIFRVAEEGGGWEATTWADASAVIPQEPGFNLGGIVATADRRAFVVAQGSTGALWRFDARTAEVTRVDTGTTDLTGADGLVLRGRTLVVVRNFPRVVATMRLTGGARTAELRHEESTAPDRVFTTGALTAGRLLLVDSKFDEPVAAPPYEVVSLRMSDVRR